MKRNCKYLVLLSLFVTAGCSKIVSINALNGPDPILYIATSDEKGNMVFVESSELDVPIKQNKLVIVTHGWLDLKGWPRQVAASIHENLPDETWICGWLDWRNDTTKLIPIEVAYYGKFKAGPILGDELLRLTKDYEHVHLLGHSCGSWVINEAAKKIAKQTSANIHLTFLDSYVPPLWDKAELGKIDTTDGVVIWSDHYFNSDVNTLSLTELTLKNAHNVDITEADPDIHDHDFAWHWYRATIENSFDTDSEYLGSPLYHTVGKVEYGYPRSLEAERYHWPQNLQFERGNKPVMIDTPKKESKPPIQGLILKSFSKDKQTL